MNYKFLELWAYLSWKVKFDESLKVLCYDFCGWKCDLGRDYYVGGLEIVETSSLKEN